MVSQITGVSNVCSTIRSGAHQRKAQSSASLAFMRGIHRSPHKRHATLANDLMTSSWFNWKVGRSATRWFLCDWWIHLVTACLVAMSSVTSICVCRISVDWNCFICNQYTVALKRNFSKLPQTSFDSSLRMPILVGPWLFKCDLTWRGNTTQADTNKASGVDNFVAPWARKNGRRFAHDNLNAFSWIIL